MFSYILEIFFLFVKFSTGFSPVPTSFQYLYHTMSLIWCSADFM